MPSLRKGKSFLPQKEPLGQSLHGEEEGHERQDGPLPGGRRRRHLFFDVIASGKDNRDTVYANITTYTGDVLRFKVDTGAQANVIPHSMFAHMKVKPPLKQSKERLISYTGQQLRIKGFINLTCTYMGSTYKGPFHIVDTASHSQPVLGLQASLQLQLIKLVLSVDPAPPMTNETVRKDY